MALREGDLIFFRDNRGRPVIHRILIIKQDFHGTVALQTKGDSLRACDEPIGYDQVMGKVIKIEEVKHIPGAGHINMESNLWRRINYAAALINRTHSKTYFLMAIFFHKLP
jgi:hypothetical protein